MKKYALALLAIFLLTAAGIFIAAKSSMRGTTVAAPPGVASGAATTALSGGKRLARPDIQESDGAESPAASASSAPPAIVAEMRRDNRSEAGAATVESTTGSADAFAAERAEIRLLATSNNPGNVAPLSRYLDHRDASIREEARNGLLMLGDKSAAPFLNAAAAKAADPVESETLKEIADYLVNPPPAEPAAPPEGDFGGPGMDGPPPSP